MNIVEGVKTLRGRSVEIPDCGRNDIPELLKAHGMKTIAEIGVYKGEYTEVLAKAGLEVIGIGRGTGTPSRTGHTRPGCGARGRPRRTSRSAR